MTDRFETFATTIAALNRSIQRIKARETEAVGLKTGHVMCMYVLGKEPQGLTAVELQKQCGEDKAAVSRTLSELTAKGYVRQDAPGGKRAYRAKIQLTPAGREAVAYINQRVEQALEAGSRGLSPEGRAEMYGALRLISDNLEHYLQGGAA